MAKNYNYYIDVFKQQIINFYNLVSIVVYLSSEYSITTGSCN